MLATIQIDMDFEWVVFSEFNDNIYNQSKLHRLFLDALCRILDLFDKYSIKATFFCVGKDIRDKKNKEIILYMVSKGHEIANHTFTHFISPPFSSLSSTEKFREIKLADKLIYECTGRKPVGFKAPGYYIDKDTFLILNELGYKYDSSCFPLFFSKLFKKIRGLSWDNNIYKCKNWTPYNICERLNSYIKEIPISVIPFLNVPFHSSLVYKFGINLFKLGILFTELKKVNLVYSFHIIDFVNLEKCNFIKYKRPDFKVSFEEKINLTEQILQIIKEKFEVIPTQDLLERMPIC